MRLPLNGKINVTGQFKEKAQPGTGLADSSGVRRHVGTDLRTQPDQNNDNSRGPVDVFAIADGIVTQSYSSGAGQTIEYRIDVGGKKYLIRNMHLSRRDVKVGDIVRQGQLIARSGNTGGVAYHFHIDGRNAGTTWNASLNNYIDVLALIAANPDKSSPPAQQGVKNWIPANAVGMDVILSRKVTSWRFYKEGTYEVITRLNPAKNGGRYEVIRLDKLPNRVIIKSPTWGIGSLPVDQDATFAPAA